jgi:hypothetical protein
MGNQWDPSKGSRDDDLAALDALDDLFTRDVDLPVLLRRLARTSLRRAREARAMQHRLELHEHWHNLLARWCIEIAAGLDEQRGGVPLPPVHLSFARSVREDQSRMIALHQLAWEGVAALEIMRHPDGSAFVRIGNKPPFWLPRSHADLLEIIAAPTPHSRDGLVDYKSLAEIARLLGKDLKTRAQRHAVQSLINKLRTRLRRAGLLPEYIHSHRKLGYRFALRQAPPDTRSTDGT